LEVLMFALWRRRSIAPVLVLTALVALLVATAGEATHLRPKGARPIRESLVPAARQCLSTNRTHGPGLPLPSCNPPANISSNLTTGTIDVNTLPSNMVSAIGLNMLIPPATGAPDMTIVLSVNDVYCRILLPTCTNTGEALDDYVGSLNLKLGFRLTDHCNSPSPGGCTDPATVIDFPFPVKVPCVSVGPGTPGGQCLLSTTVNAIIPAAVISTKRQVWEVPELVVEDGGSDGDASTTPNDTFLVRGMFQP
jgi:hypothetical protein